MTRAYPGTAELIDQGGCGDRCNDETFRIRIRMTFRLQIRTRLVDQGGFELIECADASGEISVFELEPDRPRWLRNLRICRRLERNQRCRALTGSTKVASNPQNLQTPRAKPAFVVL